MGQTTYEDSVIQNKGLRSIEITGGNHLQKIEVNSGYKTRSYLSSLIEKLRPFLFE